MNPIALYLAIGPALGLAAADVTLSFSDISQAMIRPAFRATGELAPTGQIAVRNGTAVDLMTTPSASLDFAWRHSDLRFGYGPSFTMRDVFDASGDREPLILHTGIISFSFAPEESRWRLGLTQTGSIGKRNFSSLTPIAPADPRTVVDPSVPRINLIPNVQQQAVKVAAEQTSASLYYRWARQWSSTLGVAYGISGGIDGDEVTLPRQNTENASASLDFTATRRDTFTGAASGTHTLVTNGFEYWFAQFTGGWLRSLAPNLSLAVQGGVAQVWSRCRLGKPCTATAGTLADGQYTTSIRPVVSAGLRGAIYLMKERHFALSLLLGTAVSPVVNPLTGELQTRVQGTGTLQMVADRTTVAGSIDGAQSIPTDDPNAAGLVGLGVVASHRPGRVIEFSAGYRTVWQFSTNALYDLPPQWVGFVGVAIYGPGIRL